ncbi:MAG: regulatory protein RecX [Candidatus Omnitrophota bacterium]|nr:regulatory protein RecX [Candidatus Omnitrophota bacterium]
MENYNKALNYSFLLLKYRPRSYAEIKSHLKQKGYSPAITDKVIAYLSENNYINDEEFLRIYIASSLAKGWGRRRIDLALKRFGIGEHLREEALKDREIYCDKLREIIERKLRRYSGTKNAYQKIVRYLASRGFDYEDIFKELDNLGIERFGVKAEPQEQKNDEN